MAPWTETDKYSFLLQILKQNEKAPDFSKLNIPGRTEKAMRHQWTATRKEMAALTADGTFAGAEDAGDEDGAVRTPKKRASAKTGGTPKKTKTAAKVKVEAVKEEVDGEEEDFEDANE